MQGKQLMLTRKKELDNRDHVFAKWLRKRGWTGDSCKFKNSNTFLVDTKAIAMVFYDNKACTYEVYIKE